MKTLTLTIALSIIGLTPTIKSQTISTFAGNGNANYSGDGAQATNAEINNPTGIAFDASGNLYLSDYNNNRIRKVDAQGVITTFAGNGTFGYSGDGGQAVNASLALPSTLVFDASGNAYIVDAGNNCIRKISSSGVITTVVGNGIAGYTGDGGLANMATLNFPCGIVFDQAGNMYIADRNNNAIRKVTTSGVISTFAGTGLGGFGGDGGAASSALLSHPNGVDFDKFGNLFIADKYNNRIRKVNTLGIISTVAGIGTPGSTGDGGQASMAEFDSPFGVTFDQAGNYYVSDFNNNKIRKVYPNGIITTYAGNGTGGYSGDNGLANQAQIFNPEKVTLDAMGNVYIPDAVNQRVRKVTCITPEVFITGANSPVCSGNSITLTANGANSYNWSSGGSQSNLVITPTTNNNYTLTGITTEGCVAKSVVSVTVSACTSIEESTTSKTFQVFPNPNKGEFVIHTEEVADLTILNAIGQVVLNRQLKVGVNNFDLSEQAKGVYLLKLKNDTFKIIKE
jgi:trimeric autotransporter adhesin